MFSEMKRFHSICIPRSLGRLVGKWALVGLLLGLALSSCSLLERSGLAAPKAQSSESMEVVSAGFVLKPVSKTVVLSVTAGLQERVGAAGFLRVTFPAGLGQTSTETVTRPWGAEKELRVRSSAVHGMNYLESYPVVLQLTTAEQGGEVLEEITQYIRYEVPPGSLEQMGVSL